MGIASWRVLDLGRRSTKLVLWPGIDHVAQVYTERKADDKIRKIQSCVITSGRIIRPTPTYQAQRQNTAVLLFICNVPLRIYTKTSNCKTTTHSLLIHAPTSFPFRKTSQKSQ